MPMLNRSLRWKIGFLATLSVAAAGLTAAVGGYFVNQALVEQRMNSVRFIAESGGSIAKGYYELAQKGAMSEADAKERASTAIGAIRYNGSEYLWIWTSRMIAVMHGNRAFIGKSGSEIRDRNGVYVIREAVRGGMAPVPEFVRYDWPRPNDPQGPTFEKISYSVYFKPWDWVIGTGVYSDDLKTAFAGMMIIFGLVVAGVAAVALLVGWLVARSITGPLGRVEDAMLRLVEDDQVAVPECDRRDEIGEMARALVVFKDSAVAVRRLQSEQADERHRAEQEKRAALTGMADTIETETLAALRNIHQRTTAMTATADEMSVSAARTGTSAENAAAAAGQALATAQTVASAAEQLTTSIREIGSQVSKSNTIVGRAVTAGNETRMTIEALNQEVERIGVVADMIGEIAARTNLLALNATIEAARAGDAGRGFAVVAAEVKQLATQTARSTQEITRHIGQVRSATGASVAAVMRIEQTITEINAVSGSIAAAVEQQGAATAEIARNVTETSNAAHEMQARTTEVSEEARKTGGHAAEVRHNATGLNDATEELRHSVIRAVRTSTTEVDRRAGTRFDVDLACRLTVGGRTYGARVADLSDTGAHLRGAPALQVGSRGALDLDGVGFPLPFMVRLGEEDSLRLSFELDEATAARFNGTPERLAQRRAA
jgi:methyl-accepting chemotaxis protein